MAAPPTCRSANVAWSLRNRPTVVSGSSGDRPGTPFPSCDILRTKWYCYYAVRNEVATPKPSLALSAPCGGVASETMTLAPSSSTVADPPTPTPPASPRPVALVRFPCFYRCSRSLCFRSSTIKASCLAQASSSVSTIASTFRLLLLSRSSLPLELSEIQHSYCFFFLSMVTNQAILTL